MNRPIQELLAQRESIKRHLDWLDARIAEADPAAAQTTDRPPVHDASTPVAETIPHKAPERDADAAPETEAVAEQILSNYAGGDEILTTSAKNGCIIAAVVFALLFLFLLFGLPHWLYQDKAAGRGAPDGVEQSPP